MKTIAKYIMMNNKKLDLNIFTNRNKKYQAIKITKDITDKEKRLY